MKEIKEEDLTGDQIEAIHKFGECWISGYDRAIRGKWVDAFWLWAWDAKIILKS